MTTVEKIKEKFDRLQSANGSEILHTIRKDAFDIFNKVGVPTSRHEEWKYTRIGGLINKDFTVPHLNGYTLNEAELKKIRLPQHKAANELFFINGFYSPLHSNIRSAGLEVISLEEAAKNKYGEVVTKYLGKSGKYLKDGINALNTAVAEAGVFINVAKGKLIEHPIHIYHIADAGSAGIFVQPRILVHVNENAHVQIVETYLTTGSNESLTNEVMEIVVEQDAVLEYYKIQNDSSKASQVNTTHIRQVAKSYTHTVTISLDGGTVRNNLNILLEAAHCESHLYGLYFLKGQSHIDNHTVVDNIMPGCFSNELYKGVLDDHSTGVFNGKIFVRPDAQKTNAYQSNKNVLLNENTSVYTKPQLEIFADDVKCSHGCTVGKLNEEGLFYLRSRGISEKIARSLLLHAFAIDILEHIKPEPVRNYVDNLLAQRLEYDLP